MSGPRDIFFYVFSAVALIFSLRVVLGKNAISSAFSLVMVFFAVAADFILMEAHFVAAMQVLVYAGAIMVLFVFVIMLLNADVRSLDLSRKKGSWVLAGILCAGLFAAVAYALVTGTPSAPAPGKVGLTPEKIEAIGGNTQVLSLLMFSDYILPFELTSILLMVGIVGSVALAKRRLE